MRIADVLRRKGSDVATVHPDASVREVLRLLSEHRVGALVVSSGAGAVEGIVSERDVVRRLHDVGDEVLDGPVARIMTSVVHTCRPDQMITDVMGQMSENRVRHVPVVVEHRLVGIISIGDVVKHRLETLEVERDQMAAYIAS